MYLSGVTKNRRGVGSIIAGAFIVLIILSGYEFYLLNNRTQNEYQKVLSEMRIEDMLRSQEDLKFTKIETRTDRFHVTLRNDGPELVHITYTGVFPENMKLDEPYIHINVYVKPSNVLEIEIPFPGLEPDEINKYTIQIVTERGNIFPIFYPQDVLDYPYVYILNEAVSEVIGNIIPIYESFQWAPLIIKNINPVQLIPTEDKWKSSWAVPYDVKESIIFRIKVNYYGDRDLVLGPNTGLYFQELTGPKSVQAYISYNDEQNIYKYDSENNYIQLYAFDPDNPITYTLYFAAKLEKSDPTYYIQFQNPIAADRYQCTLGIYEREPLYSQAFSLIAIEVVDK